jgi:hypothetical protein
VDAAVLVTAASLAAPRPPCTRAAAKAAALAAPSLRSIWPTLRLGGGVDTVICHDLTGDGDPELAATIFSGGTAGDTAWAVFRRVGGRWRVAFSALEVYQVGVVREGSDLVESQPVFRRDDPNCCPTGGVDHRRIRWRDGRFVVVARWHDSRYRR